MACNTGYFVEISAIFPKFFSNALLEEASLLYVLLHHLLYYEIFITLVATVLPSTRDIETQPHKRLSDCVQALLAGSWSLLYRLLERLFFIPVALLIGLFSVLSLAFWLCAAAILLTLGMVCNTGYLVLYNFMIHTVILGFLTHSMIILLSFVPSLIDDIAYQRVLLGIKGLQHSFYSLGSILWFMVGDIVSILVGSKYLTLPTEPKIEEQHLTDIKHEGEQWFWGIDSNVMTAAGAFLPKLSAPFYGLFNCLLFVVTAPIFAAIKTLQAFSLAGAITVKGVLTPGVMLFSPITKWILPHTKSPSTTAAPTLSQFANLTPIPKQS